MNFDVHVEIGGLPGIADPEGLTIERALPALGFSGVSEVHVGKIVRFILDAEDEEQARSVVANMCDRLLANPVIETTTIEVTAAGPRSRAEAQR